jgi:DUF2914 family protein/tetratricopeptide repeat protein
MPESLDARSVIEAAEQAASAGDYASAEQLLREAAQRQQAAFGPLHPGLANTLNNLGIVYEIRNKPDDAERCYREAYTIAKTVLAVDDPVAVTSRQNLTEFCEARGIPIEPPVAVSELSAPPVALPELSAPPVGPPERSTPRVARSDRSPRTFPARSLWSAFRELSMPLQVVLLSLCGLILVMLITINSWLGANGQTGSPQVTDAERPAPNAEPAASASQAKQVANTTRGRREVASAVPKASPAGAVTVAFAGLCSSLSTSSSRGAGADWPCAPVRAPLDRGAVFFYTRVKSPTETTVQHRWYHDDRLYQAVDLEIGANQRNGYRTYSRYTINSKSSGHWRVELRSRSGVLLHEERFDALLARQ